MPLSDVTIDAANRAIREVFETSSVAWRTIPHWETGDPAQTAVRADTVFEAPFPPDAFPPPQPAPGPFGAASRPILTLRQPFLTSYAQATAPTADQVVAGATTVASYLAEALDRAIGPVLEAASATSIDLNHADGGDFDDAGAGTPPVAKLLEAREAVEKAGLHSPRAVWASPKYMAAFHRSNGPDLILQAIAQVLEMSTIDGVATLKGGAGFTQGALLIGRRQVIAPGRAYEYAPGPEPVDIAVAVPPSLEIVGDNAAGEVELAVRLRYALRVKDARGLVLWRN